MHAKKTDPATPDSPPPGDSRLSARWLAAALLVLAAVAGALIWYCTVWGAGVSPDSVNYLSAAREFPPRGTHFPPLFPVMLHFGTRFFGDPAIAARWIDAILFGLSILLIGGIVRQATRPSPWPSLIAAALALGEIDLLLIHSMAWSEPLFIFFTLAAVGALGKYFSGPSPRAGAEDGGLKPALRSSARPAWLFLAAVAVAAAVMTRYIGAAWIGAGFLVLLWRGPHRRRVRDAILFAIVASLPMAAWILHNRFAAGRATDRQLVYHPITHGQLTIARQTITHWIAPAFDPAGMKYAIWGLVAASLILLIAMTFKLGARESTSASPSSTRLPSILLAFIGCYVVLLPLSLTLFDAETPLDDRILSPLYVLLLMLCVCGVWGLTITVRRRASTAIPSLCAAAISCLLLAGYGYAAQKWVRQVHADGIGSYSTRQWRTSETVAWVRAHCGGKTLIFSNAAEGLRYLTGREASLLPEKLNPGTKRANPNYARQIVKMGRALAASNGPIIFCAHAPRARRQYEPTEKELSAMLPLRLVVRLSDGTVYAVDASVPITEPSTPATEAPVHHHHAAHHSS